MKRILVLVCLGFALNGGVGVDARAQATPIGPVGPVCDCICNFWVGFPTDLWFEWQFTAGFAQFSSCAEINAGEFPCPPLMDENGQFKPFPEPNFMTDCE